MMLMFLVNPSLLLGGLKSATMEQENCWTTRWLFWSTVKVSPFTWPWPKFAVPLHDLPGMSILTEPLNDQVSTPLSDRTIVPETPERPTVTLGCFVALL